ncbi:CASP-like protein 2D1 [Dioscorea cayenensis subsp. rotundata]|uniref:CASP-like protein n=1 Tax=Dioscorea cayennensis subsp. rotundata TaxID=55577 RepID=A0AB40CQ05_DIOCR|nr:CASP-like protein 2D1 [Dioscorea cayenensis subsp. rotundata]
MVRNKQYSDGYGKVEFSNLSGFKYLVCINGISAVYAFVSFALSFFKCFTRDWILYLFDQVVAYLMVTSMAAVVELVYLANEGDAKVSWSSACNYYEKFCNRAQVSLALHVMAMVCFLILSLISAYKTFSKFDAPSYPSKEVGEQEN